MSKETLQAEIIAHDGIILSDGTLNLQHLLPKAYDLIVAYDLDNGLAEGIADVFLGDKPTFYNQFYGTAKLNDEKIEDAEWLWNEDVFSLFNNVAPDGFYFGCTEGDGACIGFFRLKEDEI